MFGDNSLSSLLPWTTADAQKATEKQITLYYKQCERCGVNAHTYAMNYFAGHPKPNKGGLSKYAMKILINEMSQIMQAYNIDLYPVTTLDAHEDIAHDFQDEERQTRQGGAYLSDSKWRKQESMAFYRNCVQSSAFDANDDFEAADCYGFDEHRFDGSGRY